MSMSAIAGRTPVRRPYFPTWPIWNQREIDAVTSVIKSGCWGLGSGNMVRLFQEEFARFNGSDHAIAVTNGSNAIEVALTALDIGPGDEVIVPDYTFISTASEVLRVGAVPILADVDESTFCIDPQEVDRAINERTKGMIPVHFAGHPADMDSLADTVSRSGLRWVEDASHAHGAEWKKKKVGNFADLATFSMQASKTMTAGEGGIIVTNDKDLAEECMSIVNCGRRKGRGNYEHFRLASNFRMTELQAAVLRVQLQRLPDQLAARNENARYLEAELGRIPGITTARRDQRVDMQGLYVYPFLYDSDYFEGLSRESFSRALVAEGIPIELSYPALHEIEVIKKRQFLPTGRRHGDEAPCGQYHKQRTAESFPVSSRLSRQMLWISNGMLLGDRCDMDRIMEAIEKIRRHAGELATAEREDE